MVSISLRDVITRRFLFGLFNGGRPRPGETMLPRIGRRLRFRRAARLCYHGVLRIVPGTGAAALGIEGRFNLTFRKY